MLPGKSYTLRDIVDIARRRWWLVVFPPLLTLLGALVYSSRLPEVYQSDMLIAIVPQRVPDEFVRSTVTLQAQERLAAIQVQIMSRTVLEPLIAEFDLYPEQQTRLPIEDVVQLMRDGIQMEAQLPQSRSSGPGTTAFRVRYSYTDPGVAARVTQRLGSIFVDQNARDRGAMALATDDFLQQQLSQARQQLEEHEKRVEAFRQKHGNELPTQLQSNMQAIQNAQLQVQSLVEAIARDRDRKLTLERLYYEAQNEDVSLSRPVTSQPAVAGGPPVGATAQEQLAAARTSLMGLEMRLTPEHPDIVRTKRLIADLERKVELERKENAEAARQERTATVAPPTTPEEALRRERLRQMHAEIESLDRLTSFKESEERRLRAQVAEYQRRIEAVPGIESEWVALNRDYETQAENYRNLLTKSEASKVSLDLENRQIGEHFRVLDPARLPVTPVSPIRHQISGAGLGVGLLLGLGVIAFLELKDASFRTEQDVFRVLSLPVLATVPHVETEGERARKLRRTLAVSFAGLAVTIGCGYVFWAMRLWTVVI